MKRLICLLSCLLLCSWAKADPLSLSLVPSSQSVMVGQSVTENVLISGFTAHPPSVGAFDLSVSFNPAILSVTAVNFGSFLGNPALFEALTSSSVLPGVVEFAEV